MRVQVLVHDRAMFGTVSFVRPDRETWDFGVVQSVDGSESGVRDVTESVVVVVAKPIDL